MSGGYLTTLRALHRNVWIYFVATALLGFSIDGGIYAVVFNLYLLRLNFGPEFIGVINSAGQLLFALASLPAGAIGDRVGYRKMMITGMALIVIGAFLLPLAQGIAPQAPGGWLIAGYSIMMLGLAVYFVNAAPFLMEMTATQERGSVFALQTGLLALAAVGGSLIGGYLPRLYAYAQGIPQNQPDPYRFPLFISATLMLFALGALLMTRRVDAPVAPEPTIPLEAEGLPVEAQAATTPREAIPRARVAAQSVGALIVAFSVIRFLQVTGIGAAGTFYNVYFDTVLHVPTAHIGLISAAARLASVPAALVIPLLVARWNAPRVVVLACVATAISLLPMIFSQQWGWAGLGYVGAVVFSAMRFPAYIAYTLELVPPNWRGRLSGSGEMAGGLSFSLIALAGGFIIVARGYNALFWLGIVLTLAGALLFALYARRLAAAASATE